MGDDLADLPVMRVAGFAAAPADAHAWILQHAHWRSTLAGGHGAARECRSAEHTSELQSLMRISYAVLCLKNKKHNEDVTHTCENKPNKREQYTLNVS